MSKNIKENILAAFREIAIKKGIKATTMDEISTKAKISKRTLYKYFRSKEEMVTTFFADTMKDIDWRLNLITTGKGDPVYKFKGIIELVSTTLIPLQPFILDDLEKYYPHIWVDFEKFRRAKMDFLENLIKEGIRQGYFRPLDSRLISAGFFTMASKVITPRFLRENSLSIKDAMEQLADFFLFGITTGSKN